MMSTQPALHRITCTVALAATGHYSATPMQDWLHAGSHKVNCNTSRCSCCWFATFKLSATLQSTN